MMKYAVIRNDALENLIEADSNFVANPPEAYADATLLPFVETTVGTKTQFTTSTKAEGAESGQWVQRITHADMDLAEAKELATSLVLKWADTFGERFTGGYPASEVQSWPTKIAQARAWLADNSAPTPLIDVEAAALGVAKADLVDKIIQNGTLFEQAAGMIAATRAKTIAAIDAQTETIALQPILDQAQIDAETLYQSLISA